MFVMRRIDQYAGGTPGIWWLWPARDLFSVAIYLFAFLGKTVTWRGRTFRIDKAGRLIPRPSGTSGFTETSLGPVAGLTGPSGRPIETPAPTILGVAR
jgi:hypothetical protein